MEICLPSDSFLSRCNLLSLKNQELLKEKAHSNAITINLKEMSEDDLITKLNVHNVIEILEIAEKRDFDLLNKSAIAFFLDNYSKVLSTEEFLKIEPMLAKRLVPIVVKHLQAKAKSRQ